MRALLVLIAAGMAARGPGGPTSAADDAPPTPPDQAVVTASRDGFSIQAEDGSFRIKVGGYAQADGRFYAADASRDGVDTFVLRRVRPMVSGTVGRYFDFTIMPDFGLGTAVVQDAFLDARFHPAFRLRAGKFKGPVGLERLQSGAALTFAERGLPTDIVPNREVGVQVHGEIEGGLVSYQVGLFDGAVDGASLDMDLNDGKDLEGRLFVQPFRNSKTPGLSGVGLGLAATRGNQLGALPTYRTVGQLSFFAYAPAAIADGNRTRLAPQGAYQYGPFRALGEWVRSRQAVRRSASDRRVFTNRAWQGLASFVLSGEAPVAGVVTPKKPFDPTKGAWGALEVAARYGALDVDHGIFEAGYADPARSARRARGWGLGVNWYLTRNVKYVVDYDHTRFSGGGPAGTDRETENALFFRAQVSF
jgi:phosphate-selective porin OprO and OprP